jgi:glycosyltransferase involved in cell wall biosynthesis
VAGARGDLRFDLVTATVDRTGPLEALLRSLAAQTHRAFRLVVVDQNADDRVVGLLASHPEIEALHLRSPRGLSRARNIALPQLAADLVAFPDDDCVYPPDLLGRVAGRLAVDPGLDGLAGRAVADDGSSDPSWEADTAVLDAGNLWNRVISFAVFLRRDLVVRVGPFDERLGLGAGTLWSSGEEVEYVVRAIRSGARIEYDPSVTVTHARKDYTAAELRAVGLRDGASVGWILRRHGYGLRTTAGMLIRPLGGAGASVARGDLARASFHAATLRGRVRGYLGAPGP